MSMHVCFYEGWCTRSGVEKALELVEKLVREVEHKILNSCCLRMVFKLFQIPWELIVVENKEKMKLVL